MRIGNQKGEGKGGLLIAVAVVGILIFVGVKIIPVKIAAYEFRDVIREECRYAAVRNDDAKVAKRIMDRAKELEIPLSPQNLSLNRTTSEMIITASYEQPVDLKVTTYTYRFNAKERAPLF